MYTYTRDTNIQTYIHTYMIIHWLWSWCLFKTTLFIYSAIFKWLTYTDLNQMMFSEELTEESPYYFLKGIKYGLESYHELFKRLCR